MKSRLKATVAAMLISVHAGAQEAPVAPDADAKAAATLARMTAEEKRLLLYGRMLGLVTPGKRPENIPLGAGYVAGIGRLAVPPLVETDASLGVSNLLDMRKGDVATALPSGLALASTWNPRILRDGGRMIGGEARAKGFNVMLVGGVNLVRDPRAGRNFEYLGEDPLLAGRLVAAQIDGVQSNNIIATIKHFAMNDQETGRSSASVNMTEAAMRESDLLAFQIGIEKGNPGSVMCAYNLVNGVFACENSFLLNEVLRRDWGFKGFVMSDWGAVHSAEALVAGLDQQSGEQLDKKRFFTTELDRALSEGRIPQAAVDTAAGRILRTIFAHRLDADPATAKRTIDYDANALIAQRASDEGIVLLRNEHDLLPLAASAKRVVLIGGHADIGVLSGGGSSQVTPVGGFRLVEKTGSGVAASIARRAYGGLAPLDALRAALPKAEIVYLDGNDPAAAAVAARGADLVIVMGEKHATEAEDHKDIGLGDGQDALIDAVAAANSRTVVVLQTGNPVAMPWREKVGAILAAWYPGQRGAASIAAILTGSVNPSGRLPLTFPADVAQLPNPVLPGSTLPAPSKDERATYGLHTNSPPFDIEYPEGSDAGYRWFDGQGREPLYAFGHGLSYTSFAYDRLTVIGGKRLRVTFRVTNTGARAGADVPQVYVRLAGKARRLIGWDKPVLSPGESRTVTIEADPRLLANFDAGKQRWVVSPGPVQVEVSHSATAPVLTATTKLSAAEIKP